MTLSHRPAHAQVTPASSLRSAAARPVVPSAERKLLVLRASAALFAAAAVTATVGSLAGCATDGMAGPGAVIASPAAGKAYSLARADSEMRTLLTEFIAFNGKPIETLTPAEARMQPTVTDAVNSLLKKQGRPTDPTQLVPGVTSAEKSVMGAQGMLPATVYTPPGPGPFPVVVYFHGGGWVIADRKVYDGGARGLAKAAGAVVVSVDYRRAPEAKFPAQHDDALAAYRWVSQNAASLNGNPTKLGLAGESAGGNLAVATAIAARDAGLTAPKAILAVYPVAQTGSLETPSYIQYATAIPLNRAMISWFLGHTLADPGQKSDTRLDLVNANLAGLPPVTIVNAEIDPLRDDGLMLEQALTRAGVPVERQLYQGVSHEFFGTAAVVPKAQAAQTYGGQRLAYAFSR